MIDDVDQINVSVNMILIINMYGGGVIHLSKIEDETNVPRSLYIPQIDTTIHGVSSGVAHDGVPYKRYTVYLRPEESSSVYKSIIEDFLSSDWVFSYDSDLDSGY
jgi:hypothetical protein